MARKLKIFINETAKIAAIIHFQGYLLTYYIENNNEPKIRNITPKKIRAKMLVTLASSYKS